MNIQKKYVNYYMENKHTFYVLRCKDQTYYAGYTNNLNKRIKTHNSGKGAKYTRARTPVECIFAQNFDSKQDAMRQEYAFKQLTREKKEQYMKEHVNEITKK